jgi:anti-sigma factor RsiW
MKCADVEILLCEYAEGALAPAEAQSVESHLAECPACAEMAADAAAALQFLARVEPIEAPPELVTKILYRTQTEPEPASAPAADAPGWWRRLFQPVLQPRFAMGMAMTILSFSMVARLAGVPNKPLTAEDLSPARVWTTLDTKVHRVWDRAVKYYENLRLVYEIQERLDEWSAQEEQDRRAQSTGQVIDPANTNNTNNNQPERNTQ